MLFGILESEDPELTILGIKWDKSSSYRYGSREAPDAIRKATTSLLYNSFGENLNDLKSFWSYRDLGNIEPESYDSLQKSVEEKVKNNYNGGIFLFLGGDHSITYTTVKAIKNVRDEEFGLIYFDAHPDLYEDYEGNRYSHACPVRRIVEDELVSGENIIQIGIRAATREQIDFAKKERIKIITASQVFKREIIHVPFTNAYISFDMDVLDPAFAPGVGNPEPGGLSTRELVEIINALDVKLISFDIVEVNPHYDHSDITSFAAAKLIKEVLSHSMGF